MMRSFYKTVNREVSIEKAIRYASTPSTTIETVFLSVDGGCSGGMGIGPIYYRGVRLNDDVEVFSIKNLEGTNNVAEFLAMVHGLAWMKKNNHSGVIYFDSMTAFYWTSKGRIKRHPSLNQETLTLVDRAEKWLRENGIPKGIKLEKWKTKEWGDIPADFELK